MAGLKKCPDCAEMVRSEARVCRFCGYRFDGARGAGGAGALADLLRRPRVTLRLPELLASWGAELREGESVSYFGYCKLDSSYGFLLLTDERVAFFAGRGSDIVIDWPRVEVREVERSGGWGRRRLRLRGAERSVTLRHFESVEALATVARQLGGAPDA
jgi:hypothetical protein